MAKRYRKGDPLRIPADDLNTFARVAEQFDQGGNDRAKSGRKSDRNPSVVDVQNKTGTATVRGNILGLGDLVYDFTDDASGAKLRPVVEGDTPDNITHRGGRFVVTIGPIDDDGFGKGIVSGLAACQVDIKTEGDRYADIDDATVGNLDSNATGGPALIVYVASSGTGVKWCIVKLGVAPEERGFWIKITGNAADGTNRSKYAFSEVYKSTAGYGGWAVLTGGRSGTTSANPARNTIEDMNTAAGMLGCGVTVANLDTDDFTLTLTPIPTGAIVWAREVVQGTGYEIWFEGWNGVDGTCD